MPKNTAFSKPANLRPAGMSVIHGRIGQSTEYVEYKPFNTTTRFLAQKCGNNFVVFEVEPGKKGSVRTLATFLNADSAAHQAHDIALNKVDG